MNTLESEFEKGLNRKQENKSKRAQNIEVKLCS